MLFRSLTEDQVEQVARGHVWSGVSASKNGLVDHLGGFFDAVALARHQAGLTDAMPYSLITYSPWMGSSGSLPAYLVYAPRVWMSRIFPSPKLPDSVAQLATMAALQNERIFAMMPYYLELN